MNAALAGVATVSDIAVKAAPAVAIEKFFKIIIKLIPLRSNEVETSLHWVKIISPQTREMIENSEERSRAWRMVSGEIILKDDLTLEARFGL